MAAAFFAQAVAAPALSSLLQSAEECVQQETKGGKYTWYLKKNFTLTKKEGEKAAANALLDTVEAAFHASKDPDKLVVAEKIITTLFQMKTKVAFVRADFERVRAMQAPFKARRIEEIPGELVLLEQMRTFFHSLFEVVEFSFPLIKCEIMNKGHFDFQMDSSGNIIARRFKEELWTKFAKTTIGLAFIARFPVVEGTIDINQASDKDVQILRDYIESNSEPDTIVTTMLSLIKGELALGPYEERTSALASIFSQTRISLGGPRNKHFLEKICPLFLKVVRIWDTYFPTGNNLQARDRPYQEAMLQLYKIGGEVAGQKAVLDQAYEKRYLNYQSLIAKPGIDPNAPIPYPSPAEWAGIPVGPSLPTPRIFADLPCGITRKIPFESLLAPAPKREAIAAAEPAAPPPVSRSPSPSMSGAAAAAPSAVAVAPSRRSPPRIRAASISDDISVPKESKQSPAAPPPSPAAPAGSPVSSGPGAAAAAPSAVAAAPSKRSPPSGRAGSAAAGSTASPFAGVNPIRKYANRVLEWEEDAGTALARPGYADLPARRHGEMIWRHAFSRDVDRFVGGPYSRRGTWYNETTKNHDILYTVFAEIKRRDSAGKLQRIATGKFEFCSDAKDVFYHRYFNSSSSDEEIVAFIRGKQELEFPPLQTSHRLFVENAREVERVAPDGKFTYSVGPLETISFNDDPNNCEITLFKLGTDPRAV